MSDSGSTINVEVVYPLSDRQEVIKLSLPRGASAGDAIERSGVLAKCPEIDFNVNKVGVYGKLCKLDTPLRDFDRVEIYRPLIADPKEVRKRRAAEGKVMKKGAADAPE